MDKIDYRGQFQEGVESYDNLTESKHIRLIFKLEKHVLIELFRQVHSEQKSVLDFACGSGRWTQFLENHFQHTTGVDVSEEMVAVAKEKCNNTEFIVSDITLDRPDDELCNRQFDIITAFRFYKNAEKPLRLSATKALEKHLRKGGLFIFDLHLNTFSFMGLLASIYRLFGLHKLFGTSKLMTRTISLRDIKKLFEGSSFEIIDYYGMGLLPGRSNQTLLPEKLLYKIEKYFTTRKILRGLSYNILIVASLG